MVLKHGTPDQKKKFGGGLESLGLVRFRAWGLEALGFMGLQKRKDLI